MLLLTLLAGFVPLLLRCEGDDAMAQLIDAEAPENTILTLG